METVNVTLREKEYIGSVTDDDAIFFASMYYDATEKKLAEQGKEKEAFIHLSNRLQQSVEQAEDKEAAETEINANIALKIRRSIANEFETRRIVCWRLLECFPNLDKELIYWHNENRFGIRLSMEELITLFMGIIAAAFKVQIKKAAAVEKTESITPVVMEAIPDSELEIDRAIAELQMKRTKIKNGR